jgi:drug/metabolite transporter (DMT)-like permease
VTVATQGSAQGFQPSALRGYLYIGAAALCWAVSATLGRAVFTGRLHLFGAVIPLVPPLMLAQSRSTFAVLMLLPMLLATRGARSLRLAPTEVRDAVLFGTLGIAASNFFYYLAIQRTSVATAIILQYLAPVFVLLWMLGRGLQRATFARVSGVVVAVVGSVFAIGAIGRAANFPWLAIAPGSVRFDLIGVIAALVAAVAFAFYNVFGRHLVERHDRWTVQLWALGGAAAGWLFINPPWKIVAAHYAPPQWGFMAIFAVTSTLLPFSFYFAGLHHLDATRAIVTSCLEPVFSILVAAIALGELVGPIQIAGMALVLASTVLVQLETQKTAAPVPYDLME